MQTSAGSATRLAIEAEESSKELELQKLVEQLKGDVRANARISN